MSFNNGQDQQALRASGGVLLVDDDDRENKGDLIFAAEHTGTAQMAMFIRECSGIVCLCLTDEHLRRLRLPPMMTHNASKNGTAFTISIEARSGVTTGVSAQDRVTTIRTAIAADACPEDLATPGHVFPLRAQPGGVFVRRGHTEGTVDLMRLAGLQPVGVLCELTNEDGSMARLPQVAAFAERHGMPVCSIEDIVGYHRVRRRFYRSKNDSQTCLCPKRTMAIMAESDSASAAALSLSLRPVPGIWAESCISPGMPDSILDKSFQINHADSQVQ